MNLIAFFFTARKTGLIIEIVAYFLLLSEIGVRDQFQVIILLDRPFPD